MNVAVLGETLPGEDRVALIPAAVSKLEQLGCEVTVVSGAGVPSHFSNEEYREAGATIAPDAEAALQGAGVVLKVQAPTDEEVAALPEGVVLISLLSPHTQPELIGRLADAKVSAFALELIPRITRAQSMDVLSSQATVAGYKAVLTGADELAKFLPMFMTAAGTIRPGKVLILGAGVAGLQAIATARRLGAKVEAFDVRPAVKEQIESLGATFLETEEEVTGEGEGGYAKELSEEQHQRELELIAAHIVDTDLVITTAQIPGRPAPRLITEEMVDSMHPGSVIVDLAATSGGNCAVTREGETVVRNGVKVMGPANLPAEIPTHASQMFSKNVETLLKELGAEGEVSLDFEDEIVAGTCVTHGGEVRHGPTKEKLG
ncbi:MAG: Re/Si-specific NAD(P)(+) transhydrogenase subunit alpha [Gemmatimonadota bacterium]|nr:Re/Si-specific NAD(P)(+) transhydrogenase subunit alpha [Gemmatimonadota bacterium]